MMLRPRQSLRQTFNCAFEWCKTISDADVAAANNNDNGFTDWLESEIEGSFLFIPTDAPV